MANRDTNEVTWRMELEIEESANMCEQIRIAARYGRAGVEDFFEVLNYDDETEEVSE